MKRKTWISLALIVLCLAVFFGYRIYVRTHTDTNGPSIKISDELLQLSIQDPREALLQGVTASDREDGDVTASLIVESIRLVDQDGTASVTYAAFDQAGNVSKATRQIRFTDYESPRFSLSAPLLFNQNSATDALSYIQATDLLDGNIARRIRATVLTEDAITTIGTHLVEFRVSNSLGDTVKIELPVEVYATGTYSGSLSLTDYLIYLPVGSDFDPAQYLESYTYRNEKISLKNGIPASLTLEMDGTVDPDVPGVYSIGYTVSTRTEDAQTMQGRSYSRLIVVVEG